MVLRAAAAVADSARRIDGIELGKRPEGPGGAEVGAEGRERDGYVRRASRGGGDGRVQQGAAFIREGAEVGREVALVELVVVQEAGLEVGSADVVPTDFGDHVFGDLTLDVEGVGDVFRSAADFVVLPPGLVVVVVEIRSEEGRLGPGGEAVGQAEGRGEALRIDLGNVVDLNEALEVGGAADGADDGKRAGGAGADDGFIVQGVGHADAGAEAAEPGIDEAAFSFATFAVASEDEGTGAAVGAGVGPGGREIRELIEGGVGGDVDVVAEAVVDGEPLADAPIVLDIATDVGVALGDVAGGVDIAGDGSAEEEGGKAVAGSVGEVADLAGDAAIEADLALDILLAEAVVVNHLIGHAHFESVLASDHGEVVIEAEGVVFGAVVGGAAPIREIAAEADVQEIVVAVGDVAEADAVFPVLGTNGEGAIDFFPIVAAGVEAIEGGGADGPIPTDAVLLSESIVVVIAIQEAGEADGAGGAGAGGAGVAAVETGEFMLVADVVVAADGKFVEGLEAGTGLKVVIADIAGGSGDAAGVGQGGLAEFEHASGKGVDAVGGDLVIGELIADLDAVDEAGGIGIKDGDLAIGGVDPVGEVAVVEFAGGDGEEGRVGPFAVAEAFVGDEEEAFVFAVVEFGDEDGPADGGSEVVLLDDGPGAAGAVVGEEVGVEFFVAEEFEGVAVEFVGTAFGDEGHESAEGAAVFGFEAVGVDGEFGDGVEGRGVEGGPGGLEGATGGGGDAVEGYTVGRGLAAADGEVVVAVVRGFSFGGEEGEIEGATHVAGDDEGERVDEFVGNGGLDFGIFHLDLGAAGADFDGLLAGTDFEDGVEAVDAGGGDGEVFTDEGFEAFFLDTDGVGADGEGGEGIVAGVGGDGRISGVGLGLGYGDAGTGDGGSGGIFDGASDKAAVLLRE